MRASRPVDAWELVSALVNLRKARGLTQRQVARAMGCPQPWISRLEQGRVDPQLSTVVRYAEVLGAEVHLIDASGSAG